MGITKGGEGGWRLDIFKRIELETKYGQWKFGAF